MMKFSKTPLSKDIHTYSNKFTCLIRLYVDGHISHKKYLQLMRDLYNDIVQVRKDAQNAKTDV